MSLITESSIRRNRGSFHFLKRIYVVMCPCLPTRRRISPIDRNPPYSTFVSFGKKGRRVIRVVHIDSRDNTNVHNQQILYVRDKLYNSYQDSDSDSSSDEYWFTKWTLPLRTVKSFQHQSSRKIKSFISTHLSSFRSLKRNEQGSSRLISYAANHSSQIIIEASKEASKILAQRKNLEVESDWNNASNRTFQGGIINPSFIDSEVNLDAIVTDSNVVSKSEKVVVKPLVYFIHGVGESSDSWKTIMEYFSHLNYEVVAMDLLGHGYSSAPKEENCYTFKKLLKDVIRVFDYHVFENRKAIIIAHGYGCSFAVSLCRQRSSNVTLLVLLSSGGPTPLAPPVEWRREFKLPASLLRCLRTYLPCGIKRNVFYGLRGKSCIHDTTQFQSLPSYLQHHLAVGQCWPEGDVAFHRKVPVPTLLIHGMRDQFVSLVEMCEMERTIPRAFLEVIPGSGHDIMADAPIELCKMLRKFVEHWER